MQFSVGANGIFDKSRDPGIFRDGISLIFLSRDFSVNIQDSFGAKALESLFCLIQYKSRNIPEFNVPNSGIGI